jgi:hypothetical protein
LKTVNKTVQKHYQRVSQVKKCNILVKSCLLFCATILSLFSSEPHKKTPVLNLEEQQELNSLLYDDDRGFASRPTEGQRTKLGRKAQKKLFKLCRIPNSKDEKVDLHSLLNFYSLLRDESKTLIIQTSEKMEFEPNNKPITEKELALRKMLSVMSFLIKNQNLSPWLKEDKLVGICGQRNRPRPGSSLKERLDHFLAIVQKRTLIQLLNFSKHVPLNIPTGKNFHNLKRALTIYAQRILRSETDNSISDSEIWAALLIKQEQLLSFTSDTLKEIEKVKELSNAKLFFEEKK